MTIAPRIINPVKNSRGVKRIPRELSRAVNHAVERRGIISNGIKIYFLTIFTIALALVGWAEPVGAATYAATQLISSPPVSQLDQKEVYGYTIGLKNTGTETWQKNGKPKQLTIKTTEPIRWEHWFANSAWIDKLTATAFLT